MNGTKEITQEMIDLVALKIMKWTQIDLDDERVWTDNLECPVEAMFIHVEVYRPHKNIAQAMELLEATGLNYEVGRWAHDGTRYSAWVDRGDDAVVMDTWADSREEAIFHAVHELAKEM